MSKYRIETSQPAPSMNRNKVYFEGTYPEAVAATQDAWRALGYPGSAVLFSENGHYYWHYVSYSGVATDRNKNSGVPEVDQIIAA